MLYASAEILATFLTYVHIYADTVASELTYQQFSLVYSMLWLVGTCSKVKRYTRWLTTAPTVCTGQQLFWPLVPIWLFRSETETAYWDGVDPELVWEHKQRQTD